MTTIASIAEDLSESLEEHSDSPFQAAHNLIAEMARQLIALGPSHGDLIQIAADHVWHQKVIPLTLAHFNEIDNAEVQTLLLGLIQSEFAELEKQIRIP